MVLADLNVAALLDASRKLGHHLVKGLHLYQDLTHELFSPWQDHVVRHNLNFATEIAVMIMTGTDFVILGCLRYHEPDSVFYIFVLLISFHRIGLSLISLFHKGLQDSLKQPFGIVQIDAHADLRTAYQGEPHSHASVMQLCCSADIPLFQLGVRALCREEVEARRQHNVGYCDADRLVRQQLSSVTLPNDFPELVYVSFDLDGLDPAVLPATGTPVPGGLGFYQALDLVSSACSGRKIIGMDIVELAPSPAHPASNFTAALVTYHLIALALSQR